MDRVVPRILRFDRFALDLRRGFLRAGGEDIELRPKAFEVLCYLVENAGRLISQEELHEAVWGNVAVSNDSIVQCIRELRSKLGDPEHRLIKTVARRGYVLDAVVSEQEASSPSRDSTAVPAEGREAERVATQWRRMIPRLGASLALIVVVLAVGVWTGIHEFSRAHARIDQNTAGGNAPPRAVFRDCPECPEMIALPAGEFMMGSSASEFGHQDIEGPPRHVAIARRFALGKFKVTVDQFARFVAETGMTVSNTCRVMVEVDRDKPLWGTEEASFRHPGFDTAGSHPVVCVSWYEAQAYATWLQRRTGRPYRLLTESEWEYAARAGTQTRYSFGDDETQLCAYARFADLGSRFGWHDACRGASPAYGTVPVGSLKPNSWGLFDMHGNAWEWVQDCWTPNAADIPVDGSAFTRRNGCEEAVIRGGSFASPSRKVRSATRGPSPTSVHNYNNGFRVALSLD
jgi:formylglycine-generating enzyme required for sulfatase activity